MRRLSAALAVGLTILVGATAARADDHLLNLELTGGAGVSAYNSGSDSMLAPPFVQLHAAYLLIETGPVAMGPALGVPLGFFQPEDDAHEGSWVPQVAVRPGWAVHGRPSVDYAWSVVAGPAFVVTPPFVWGLEVGGSFTYFLTAGFGLVVGVDYGLFYGVDPAHIFSGKLGLMISWEVGS